MSAQDDELEHLANAPIMEVACGLKFNGVTGLDAVVLSAFREECRSRFPRYEIHPALRDANELIWSASPLLRLWLISAGLESLVQVQHDRFFFNWRASAGGSYPRFNDHDDQEGVLTLVLREFEHFCSFSDRALKQQPQPVRCDLTKVDRFVEGEHWSGNDDLVQMLPVLQSVLTISRSDNPSINLQFAEQHEGNATTINVTGSLDASPRFVTLETQIQRPLAALSSLRACLIEANTQANRMFAQLVSASQRSRFRTQTGEEKQQ